MSEPRIRLALADDHPLFRDGVRRALEAGQEFEVVGEVSEGEATVHMVLSRRPDVLLLDLALPDISGIEVLRRLNDAGAKVRTLILTGAIDRLQTLEVLQLGARGVLMKDAAGHLLVKALRAIMKGEYWIGRQTMADWTEYARQHRAPRLMLTDRERQVIVRMLEGMSNREIAEALSVGEETIKTHVSNIYRKLGISNRMELALYVASGKLKQPL